MPVRSLALRCVLALAVAVLPVAASAQANTFDILLDGKRVGKDIFTLAPAKKGFRGKSRLTFRLGGADQDFSGDYEYDENYAFKSLQVTNHVQTGTYYFLADKAQTHLEVITQTSAHATISVDVFPDLMLLPPFDAAAAQAILLLAVTHPTKDDLYGVYVPSVVGGGGGRNAAPAPLIDDASAQGAMEPANIPYHAKWFKGNDSGGKLDGKPTLLHTYLLGYGRARYYFYADVNNQLMEVDIPGMKASYVRANFQLNAKPAAATAH